jgi:hypothetical protein
MDLFDTRAFGPPPHAQPLPVWRRDFRRHSRWLRGHHWAAQIVIVTGELALAYLALVFGILFGVGIRGF